MNTSGIQRGYMAKNMKAEEFIKVVVSALSMEFEKEIKLEVLNNHEFRVVLDNYKINMSMEFIEKYKNPYGLDRYILESFEKSGFKFDRNRSQYIQYCFGNYKGI